MTSKIQMMNEISARIDNLFDAKYRNHNKQYRETQELIERMYEDHFVTNIEVSQGVDYECASAIRDRLYEKHARAIKKKYDKRNQRLALKIKRLVNQRRALVFS